MSGEGGSLGEIRRVLAGITRRLDALAAAVGGAAPPAEPAGALLDEPTRRRLAPLESILDVTRRDAPAEARRLALDRAIWHARADGAAVLVPRDGRLDVLAEQGLPGLPASADVDGIVGRALASGEVVQAGPGLGAPDAFLAPQGLEAAVAVPLHGSPGAPAGVLLAVRRRPVPFDAEALEVLLLVADRLASRLTEKGEAGAAASLDPAAHQELLAAALELPRAAAVVASQSAARLGAAAVAVLVPAADGFTVAGGAGLPADARAPGGRVAALMDPLATGRPWVPDAESDAEPELARCLGATPRAVLPLIADDSVIALLAVGAATPCGTALPEPFARMAALALRNARLHGEAVRALGEARPPLPVPAGTDAAPLGEIAGLLAAVLGRLVAVRERLVDPDAARDLAAAEEAAWRVAEAVRGLLGFAPTAAEHGSTPVDLGPLVRAAVRSAEGRWNAAGGGPPVDLAVEAVAAVTGSAEELRHALDHLLQNAREAGDGRTPIGVRLRWDGATRITVEIADQGRGMDEATRARAGEPFFTTKGPGRLGVGLAVARAAALRHRGDLQIETVAGRGTTVRLRLPAVAGPAGGGGGTRVAAGGPRRRVLVVEDETPVRDSVVEALELDGYAVRAASSGPEAVALLRGGAVDAVVTDLALPGGSGLEVGRVAKEVRHGTPVVLLTGWPGRVDAATLERHGIDAVVEKPVGLETLCATLATLLARSPSPPPREAVNPATGRPPGGTGRREGAAPSDVD